ncbi:MAG TPA: DUF6328 family protein [Pyrinomonadaceae bacterium]
MAKLKDKLKMALDEGRMLVLGSQVLIGFQYRVVLEKGFEKLPESSKYLKLGALCLMLVATALLMSTGAFHRIVEEGEITEDTHTFTTKVLGMALLPFAFAFGIDAYVMTRHLMGYTPGLVAGVGMCAVTLFFWYGLEAIRRASHGHEGKEGSEMGKGGEKEGGGGAKLKDKIEQALTEARVVLPGAQALLGFQFASMLVEGFEKLPNSSKYVHLASLFLMAVAIVLLMAPAAYHRIVEEGEESEHFHRVASRMLIAAMIPLAAGICGDLFVVARKITESATASIVIGGLMLLFFYGLWFGYTIYRRGRREASAQGAESNGRQFAS